MQHRLNGLALAAIAFTSALMPCTLTAQETTTNLPAIVVIDVVKRQLTDAVTATGTIRPVDDVFVQPLVEGLSIDKINVDVGDIVEAGAVLAELSQDSLLLQKSQFLANRAKAEAGIAQFDAQVLEATANFNDAEQQRNRAQTLGRSGSGTVAQVERATAGFEIGKARLEAAKQAVFVAQADLKVIDAQLADIDLRLARTQVKAPVAGVVSQRSARIGAIASASAEPLFTLIKDNAIELVAELSETDIQKVKVGQSANVMLAGGRSSVEGKVRLVAPTVDPKTRLAAVHLTVDNDGPARSGMYGTANIIISHAEDLALPLSAVTETREGVNTRLVKDGVVQLVPIKTGIKDDGFVQVLEGLNTGDQVVEKAGAFVRNGDRINPVVAKTNAVN
jgi:HlyD family secretion protein